jgi:exonuclease SbcD
MAIRALVTADWHIGKRLHQEDLSEDMQLFFSWLLDKIKELSVDYLLVAGDIFDQQNPSNESGRVYFDFISRLIKTGCKAVFIAGNHDSPGFIDHPAALLEHLDVHVRGIFPGTDAPDRLFIPMLNREGRQEAVVAAIPFLQDRFIRTMGEGEGASEIAEKIKSGIRKVFKKVVELKESIHPDMPCIGMAHLHAQGTKQEDSEREIQIGNLEGVSADSIGGFDYLVLGHIHTGQPVVEGRIQYASSPISLGFSENKYNHKVILLDIDGKDVRETMLPVPKCRSLYQVKGTLAEVTDAIENLKGKYALTSLLDIHIEEKEFNPEVQNAIERWKDNLEAEKRLKVVNVRVRYSNTPQIHAMEEGVTLKVDELSPVTVFEGLIKERTDEAEKAALMELFKEIYSEAIQSDQ